MNRIFLLLSATMMALGAHAQTMFGGRLGADYSIYNTETDDDVIEGTTLKADKASGIGFHIGMCFQYNFARHAGIRPELLFSMRNTKVDLGAEDDYVVDTVVVGTVTKEGDEKMSFSYLEIPILLAFDLGDHIAVHVGPGFGFALGTKFTRDLTETTSVPPNDPVVVDGDADLSGEDAKKFLDQRAVEIAACVGAVYEFDSGFNFGLRYWKPFTPLQEDNDKVNTKASVFQLTLGWNFADDRRHR